MLDYVRGKGIPLTAYAPLAQGRAAHDETLQRIGTKHGVSAAQIAIAWLPYRSVAQVDRRRGPGCSLSSYRSRT
jgi:2,5-diketo-D-gluconate reductase B